MTDKELMQWPEGDATHFKMDSIEVDGVEGYNDSDIENFFFSLKYEEDSFGNVADVGREFHWQPNIEVSEKHWLSCSVVIPLHSRCLECGERD